MTVSDNPNVNRQPGRQPGPPQPQPLNEARPSRIAGPEAGTERLVTAAPVQRRTPSVPWDRPGNPNPSDGGRPPMAPPPRQDVARPVAEPWRRPANPTAFDRSVPPVSRPPRQDPALVAASVGGPNRDPRANRTTSSDGGQPPTPPRRPRPVAPPPRAQRPPSASGIGEQDGLSLIERLILRGARGELITAPWFQSLRQGNADMAVRFVTVGVILFTVAVQFGITSTTATGLGVMLFVEYPLWFALGYFYMAMGTKLAYRFLLWGFCVCGTVFAVLSLFPLISALLFANSLNRLLGVHAVSLGLLAFGILTGVVMAGVFGYLTVMVHRGIKRLGE